MNPNKQNGPTPEGRGRLRTNQASEASVCCFTGS